MNKIIIAIPCPNCGKPIKMLNTTALDYIPISAFSNNLFLCANCGCEVRTHTNITIDMTIDKTNIRTEETK